MYFMNKYEPTKGNFANGAFGTQLHSKFSTFYCLGKKIEFYKHAILHSVSLIGYEPAGLTVHPPPQNDRGWVHFFRMGV